MILRDLIDRDSFIHPGVSAALGAAVTHVMRGDLARQRNVLGIIVDVPDDRRSVWVRRYTDGPDVAAVYSVSELELATPDDLVQVARYFLQRQYNETRDLQAAIRREG